MSNTKQQWLDSLKVGDKVTIDVGSFGFPNYKTVEIIRITPTRIFKTNDGRAFDSYGREKGKSYAWQKSVYLLEPTTELMEKVEKMDLLRKIENIKFKELSLEKLRIIANIKDLKIERI